MTIFIAGLEMPARIGVHDNEYGRTQMLLFDIKIKLTPTTADEIASTLDYEIVVELVERVLGEGHIQLVETVARRIAHALRCDPRLDEVVVRAALPRARAAGVIWSTSHRAPN
jgi:dihydroneopterin aldolase